MKKIGILGIMLLLVLAVVMAQDTPGSQALVIQDNLFAGIDEVALSVEELTIIDGEWNPVVVFVAGAIAGGFVYDSVVNTTRRLSGKTPIEHYEGAVDRAVKSVKDYFTNYEPDANAAGPRARARARG